MDIQMVEEKIKSYKKEVTEFHPFLKNFLPKVPHIKHVEYTHGNSEYGVDFILIEEDDKLKSEKYIGVIVKTGKIRQSSVEGIERQIRESFKMPKIVFNGSKEVNLKTVWLISNDTITSNARRKIFKYFREVNIEVIDSLLLSRLVAFHHPEYINGLVENVFAITNQHVPDSGELPKVDTEGKYKGYYENVYGEQFIFLGDRQTERAVIYGGDFGWETEIVIFAGMDGGDWIFGDAEILWISNCYATMTNSKIEEIYNEFFHKLNPFNALAGRLPY
ncbi:hypothetical protein LEM8419_01969 [Neolewinella maritima]|uniref:Restriction endonuclease type IV Mrr domain-containing protein n=1 Tax=Neolewinella maritima TaxID=1383882 RepID=A0ABN8F4U3_9BACT|nr:hypothetical protein [Neolewinella maritima]CAH1000956.1 hypothetical protein LEM8419_01969 [Neolewinella maritima]